MTVEVNHLFFVPIEKGDWLGHADGMGRFIANDTVLINDFNKEEQKDYIDCLGALHNARLKWKTFLNLIGLKESEQNIGIKKNCCFTDQH
jgi:agmatine deiminase